MISCAKEELEVKEINLYLNEINQIEGIDPYRVEGTMSGVWAAGSFLRFIERGTSEIKEVEWNKGSKEGIMGMVEKDGILYLCVLKDDQIEIRSVENQSSVQTIATISCDQISEIMFVSDFWIEKEGNIYFVVLDTLYEINMDSGIMNEFDNISLAAFVEDDNGTTQCIYSKNGNLIFSDLESGQMNEIWETQYASSENLFIVGSNDEELQVIVDTNLLWIDRKTGCILSESNLTKSGIAFSDILGGILLQTDSNDPVLYLYERNQQDLMEYVLSEKPVKTGEAQNIEDENERKEIIYAIYSISSDLEEKIAEFNRTNTEYYITIETYGAVYIEDWISDLQMAYASGKDPDLINLRYLKNYYDYVDGDYFEDLTPYIESMSDNDIMMQILEPYQKDGKTYVFLPHFSFSCLLLSPEDSVQIEDWNLDTMLQLAHKYEGEKDIFSGSYPSNRLYGLLYGMMDVFVNHEESTCSFNSEEFIELLRICKGRGDDELSVGDVISMQYMLDNYIFNDQTILSHFMYVSYFEEYGRNYPMYGYPNAEGASYVVRFEQDACSISSESKVKEGAWEFIETLLEPSYQESECFVGLPIRSSSYEAYWENTKDMDINVNDIKIEGLTDEEVDQFINIVNEGSFKSIGSDQIIIDIVLEEADAYFLGDKEVDAVADIIQNRVSMVLNERKD